MQQMAFCGFTELSPELKQEFVAHCMDKKHHARRNKNSKAYNDGAASDTSVPAPASASASATSAGASTSSASNASFGSGSEARASAPASASPSALAHYVPPITTQLAAALGQGGLFILPRPGVNGAKLDAFRGKTFVLTGEFPEVGGGAGLNLGKDRVKAMIESFGGRVTGSVSNKTDYVLIGASPGSKKVSEANARGLPTPNIQGLKLTLETEGATLEMAPSARITSLSSGYKGNGREFLEYDKSDQFMLGAGSAGAATGGFKAKKKRAAPKAPKQPKKARASKKAAASEAAEATDDSTPPSKKRRTTAK